MDTFPVTQVIRSLVSWKFCHLLSGQSNLKKPYILQLTTRILFSHSVLPGSLLGRPGRTTLLYLSDGLLWLPHLRHWTPVEKSASIIHSIFTHKAFHPKSLFSISHPFSLFFKSGQVTYHGKVHSERKRGSSPDPDNKILLGLLSKSLFLFCASRGCLVQSFWAQIISPHFIYQGALW